MERVHRPRWLFAQLPCCVVLLGLAALSCSPQQVTIKRFQTLTTTGKVEVNKGIGVSVDVDNPANRPLTYKWITTRGSVRVGHETDPTGTYEAPDTPGTETVTVQVMSGDTMVAQQALQIEVVNPVVAAGPGAGNPDAAAISATATAQTAATATAQRVATEQSRTQTPIIASKPTSAASQPTPPPTGPTVGPAENAFVDTTPCRESPVPEMGNATLEGQVQITSPETCAQLSTAIISGEPTVRVGGTSSGVAADEDIWVFVCPHQAVGVCWPQPNAQFQNRPVQMQPDGRWSGIAILKVPQQWYDVVLLLARKSGGTSDVLQYMKQAPAQGYPGMHLEDLNRLQEMTRVTVYRK